MADLVPTVTDITGTVTTFDAAGILAALYTHFSGTSTDWTVVDANTTTNTGDEGINLTPTSVSYTFSINLRNKAGGTIIAVGVDPEGGITDAGNSTPTTPTGTGARWSGEQDWTVTATDFGSVGAGSQVHVIETADHFAVFIGNTTSVTISANGISVGEIYDPTPVTTDGTFSGLGMLVGKPDTEAGSTDDWTSSGLSPSRVEFGSTGVWHRPYAISEAQSLYDDGTDGEAIRFPAPMKIFLDTGDHISCCGVWKYWRAAGGLAPKSQESSTSSNQSWIHIDSGSSSEFPVYIWNKLETP